MNDIINSPPHYKGDVEPFDLIVAQELGWCEANIVKYVVRHKRKDGPLDLDKANWYLQKLRDKYKTSSSDKQIYYDSKNK